MKKKRLWLGQVLNLAPSRKISDGKPRVKHRAQKTQTQKVLAKKISRKRPRLQNKISRLRRRKILLLLQIKILGQRWKNKPKIEWVSERRKLRKALTRNHLLLCSLRAEKKRKPGKNRSKVRRRIGQRRSRSLTRWIRSSLVPKSPKSRTRGPRMRLQSRVRRLRNRKLRLRNFSLPDMGHHLALLRGFHWRRARQLQKHRARRRSTLRRRARKLRAWLRQRSRVLHQRRPWRRSSTRKIPALRRRGSSLIGRKKAMVKPQGQSWLIFWARTKHRFAPKRRFRGYARRKYKLPLPVNYQARKKARFLGYLYYRRIERSQKRRRLNRRIRHSLARFRGFLRRHRRRRLRRRKARLLARRWQRPRSLGDRGQLRLVLNRHGRKSGALRQQRSLTSQGRWSSSALDHREKYGVLPWSMVWSLSLHKKLRNNLSHISLRTMISGSAKKKLLSNSWRPQKKALVLIKRKKTRFSLGPKFFGPRFFRKQRRPSFIRKKVNRTLQNWPKGISLVEIFSKKYLS